MSAILPDKNAGPTFLNLRAEIEMSLLSTDVLLLEFLFLWDSELNTIKNMKVMMNNLFIVMVFSCSQMVLFFNLIYFE